MTGLVALVESMPPDQQEVAAKVLNACSHSLSAREIEAVLRHHHLPKSRAIKGTFEGFRTNALLGPKHGQRVSSSLSRVWGFAPRLALKFRKILPNN